MSLPTVALVVALAAAPPQDVPLPARPPSTSPAAPATPVPEAPPKTGTRAAAPPRRAARIGLAATAGLDFGFTDLLTVEMDDGSKRAITANQGVFASIGATFPHLDGRLEAQATLGIKYSGISASNGSASFLVFPIEILEAVKLAPLRLAGGIVYVHQPATSGDGVLSGFDVKFDSSLGVVLQGEWLLPLRTGGQLSFGPRVVWQKFQVRGDGPVVGANALGAVVSFSSL